MYSVYFSVVLDVAKIIKKIKSFSIFLSRSYQQFYKLLIVTQKQKKYFLFFCVPLFLAPFFREPYPCFFQIIGSINPYGGYIC